MERLENVYIEYILKTALKKNHKSEVATSFMSITQNLVCRAEMENCWKAEK